MKAGLIRDLVSLLEAKKTVIVSTGEDDALVEVEVDDPETQVQAVDLLFRIRGMNRCSKVDCNVHLEGK